MEEERRVNLQEVGRAVERIANNDIPHIQTRLHSIDIHLAELRVSVGWLTRLLLATIVLAASVLIGVIIDTFI